MARISYVEEKDHPELAGDIAKIKGARGGLINIYKLLLHSPTVTMTWFEHIGAIRWKTKLTPRLREIAIVRVAQAARYAYALQQHVPGIAVPDGVRLDECEALKGLARFGDVQRGRARGARLCRCHDRRPRGAGRRVQRGAQALQRARGGRADRAGRHLPHAQPRVHGAAGRSRTEKN